MRILKKAKLVRPKKFVCELKCVKSLCICSHFKVGWPLMLVA